HHHHHDDDDDDDEDEHEHHHHEHGPDCTCGCHDHDHDHHDHDHHHHHHADEVFTSWGMETPNVYSKAEIEKILTALDSGEYGVILRAKGMVPAEDGTWIYYDYVPEEQEVRTGKPEVTGKICVIGSKLEEEKLAALFRK
ncbi:MAG: cobalamin biosynthesis protein CobW, partial [Lachnospiraceae bacterium]|nr:cobalamin biosynthesis protein CobW [Lachnospiraceae bacterium]